MHLEANLFDPSFVGQGAYLCVMNLVRYLLLTSHVCQLDPLIFPVQCLQSLQHFSVVVTCQ